MSTLLAKKVQSGYACALNNERVDVAASRKAAFGREPAAGGLRDVQDRLRALRGTLGYRRWLLRGRAGVEAEGRLFKLGYQIRKVHTAWAEATATAQ